MNCEKCGGEMRDFTPNYEQAVAIVKQQNLVTRVWKADTLAVALVRGYTLKLCDKCGFYIAIKNKENKGVK